MKRTTPRGCPLPKSRGRVSGWGYRKKGGPGELARENLSPDPRFKELPKLTCSLRPLHTKGPGLSGSLGASRTLDRPKPTPSSVAPPPEGLDVGGRIKDPTPGVEDALR